MDRYLQGKSIKRFAQKIWKSLQKETDHFRLFWRTLETIPMVLPVGIAVFGVVSIFFLIMDQLKDAYVWPAGLALSIGAAVVVGKLKYVRPGSIKEQRIGDLLIIAMVAIWTLVNINYASQNIFIYRDPGIYTVTGAWLIDHDNLNIPIPTVFSGVEDVTYNSSGFGFDLRDKDLLFAQGLHLLPALLGLFGRIGGEAFMLSISPIFGAIALLAVYGFARLIAKPRWAVVVTLAFSLTLPLVYFSRDAYTEPLSTALTFGALALLWLAAKQKNLGVWFLAGLTTGSVALTRADGYLPTVALVIFLIILLATSSAGKRLELLKRSFFTLVGALLPIALSFFDAALLSSGYYAVHGIQIRQQLLLITVLLATGIFILPFLWSTSILAKINKITKRWLPWIVGGVVILTVIALASRPLWYVSYESSQAEVVQELVTALQEQAGEPSEPTRNYAENTARWITWYLGPALTIFGVMGLAIAAGKSTMKKNLLLLPSVLLVAGSTLVFMIKVGITPDQVWASRRFLPYTLPGLTVFAAMALDRVSRVHLGGYRIGMYLSVIAAPVIIIGPVVTSRPFLRTQTYESHLGHLRSLCNALPENAAVLWVGPEAFNTIQSVRTFCDVPAARVDRAGSETLSAAAANAHMQGYEPVLVISESDKRHLSNVNEDQLTGVSSNEYRVVPSTLYGPPTEFHVEKQTILAGLIAVNGKIKPLL